MSMRVQMPTFSFYRVYADKDDKAAHNYINNLIDKEVKK